MKNEEFCIKTEKCCIKNEEFCIKNDELIDGLSALQRRALASGAAAPSVDAALDGASPREAMISIIVSVKNDAFCITKEEFCIIKEEFLYQNHTKTRNCASKTRKCVSKMMILQVELSEKQRRVEAAAVEEAERRRNMRAAQAMRRE